jgi:voltage-gated potassium channel
VVDSLSSRAEGMDEFVHRGGVEGGEAALIPKPLVHTRTCRHVVWMIVEGGGHPASKVFQAFIMLLIVINVACVIVETDPNIASSGWAFKAFYAGLEWFSVVIFSLEYLSRIWSCAEAPGHRSRLHWATRPLPVIDFVAILPFIVDLATPPKTDYRGLSLVRLLRVFSLIKMERSFKGFARIANVMSIKREELIVTAFIAAIMLIVSASIMYYVESGHYDGLAATVQSSYYAGGLGGGSSIPPAPPPSPGCAPPTNQFTSISMSTWWSVAALTTTGYGDMVPQTTVGRLLGGLIGFLGVVFFALPAGILGSGFTEVLLEEKQRRKEARERGTSSTGTGGGAQGRQAGSEHLSSAGSSIAPSHDGLEVIALEQALRALQTGQVALAGRILEERLGAVR